MLRFLRARKQTGSTESREALEDAHKNLEKMKARSDEVTGVSTAMRELRERNHFAEKLSVIMGGGYQ